MAAPKPKMVRAVFLDRDGVLIRSDLVDGKPIAVQVFARMEILPGVPEACFALREAGFLLVIVTNQPDVGRGLVARSAVDSMNAVLASKLGISAVKVCFHDGLNPCACRKPRPGMLLDAARELEIDLSASVMVGDRSGDILAGRRAGCKCVFIDWGHSELLQEPADHVANSLPQALDWILRV